MSALAPWFERFWYGQQPVPAWCTPLEALYRAGIGLRRMLYRFGLLRVRRLSVPVIVVGNITVGGTGKTPLTAWIVRELRERGWSPGIVLRGYRGRARGAHLVEHTASAREVGDEAVLLRQLTQCPVAVGRDRVAAARLLLGQGCDMVVSDDGLQHWRLARDLEIAVVDGVRRCGNGRLLPAGPLREPAERLRDVDHLVCNGGPAQPGEWPMQVYGAQAINLADPTQRVALGDWRGRCVHAVAGIGNPERFFAMLAGFGIEVIRHALPDHHDYRGDELCFDDEHPVLLTEKDAVKCTPYANARCWVVPVEAVLPAEFAQALHRRLCQLRESHHD